MPCGKKDFSSIVGQNYPSLTIPVRLKDGHVSYDLGYHYHEDLGEVQNLVLVVIPTYHDLDVSLNEGILLM